MIKIILNKILKSKSIWLYLAKMISKKAEKKGLNGNVIYEIVLLLGSLVTKKKLSDNHDKTIAQIDKIDISHIA